MWENNNMRIKLNVSDVKKNTPKVFFTSDTHYNHKNICRGVSVWKDGHRDFDTIEQMNDAIVNNINNKVGENDILFFLGDWSFGGFESIEIFRKRIVCKTIHLVLGNHDHFQERNKGDIRNLFASVNHYLNLNVLVEEFPKTPPFNYDFVLFHYPICSWENMNKGVILLHGHVHLDEGHKIGQGKSLDVGMDGNNMEVYSLTDIIKLMEKQPISKLSLEKDHHTTEKN